LDTERKEREEQAEKHKAELQKYKDQGVQQTLQLAARDRKIQELLRNQEDSSATSSAEGEEAAEETKEDS
jgi:uncharacterized protein YciI